MHDTLHTQSISFDYVPLVWSSLGDDDHHNDYKAEALHDGDDHDDQSSIKCWNAVRADSTFYATLVSMYVAMYVIHIIHIMCDIS